MKKLILALILSLPLSASADELIIHTVSYHVGHRTWLKEHDSLNEVNYGVGIKTDKMIVGVYKNSESNTSLYINQYRQYGPISINYGVVTGYLSHPILPMISASYNLRNVSISAIPSMTEAGYMIVVLHAAMKFKID